MKTVKLIGYILALVICSNCLFAQNAAIPSNELSLDFAGLIMDDRMVELDYNRAINDNWRWGATASVFLQSNDLEDGDEFWRTDEVVQMTESCDVTWVLFIPFQDCDGEIDLSMPESQIQEVVQQRSLFSITPKVSFSQQFAGATEVFLSGGLRIDVRDVYRMDESYLYQSLVDTLVDENNYVSGIPVLIFGETETITTVEQTRTTIYDRKELESGRRVFLSPSIDFGLKMYAKNNFGFQIGSGLIYHLNETYKLGKTPITFNPNLSASLRF